MLSTQRVKRLVQRKARITGLKLSDRFLNGSHVLLIVGQRAEGFPEQLGLRGILACGHLLAHQFLNISGQRQGHRSKYSNSFFVECLGATPIQHNGEIDSISAR